MEWQDEEDQLPTARMMDISRISFWIYFAVCAILFIIDLFTTRQPMADWTIPAAIALCVFVDLSLELVRQRRKADGMLLTYTCYGFEAATAIVFAIIVFGKLIFR